MINYYKYLPLSEEDENWGISVLNVGSGRTDPSGSYPAGDHPAHHNFKWNNGRVLHEYQLIYITKGKGIFESMHCPARAISEGTMIMLFPGEWHRYRPDMITGWDEHWVGFKGNVADNLIKKGFFKPVNPALDIGFNEKIVNIFLDIAEGAKQEKTGYQPLISGLLLYLLGFVHYTCRQKDFADEDKVAVIVNKAKIFLRDKIDEDTPIEKVAVELKVGYSWFRKAFKRYTGLAPGQYLIQLKIERSKQLLFDSKKSVKEIAYELKFDSSFYFSKLFKEKTGLTPTEYREISFRKQG